MQIVALPHDDLLRVPFQTIFYDTFTALVLGPEPSSPPTYVFLRNLCTTLRCLRGRHALFLGLYLTSGSSFLPSYPISLSADFVKVALLSSPYSTILGHT